MTNAATQIDEMESDYEVDYRPQRAVTTNFERTPRAQYLVQARHSRRAAPQVQNGIHRRGRKRFV